MLSKFREPVSGFSHLGGMILALIGTFVLVRSALNEGNCEQTIALGVYGASLILLYGASALYHLPVVSEACLAVLRRIDHIMIYVLIAGTYTPVCLLTLGGTWGQMLLAAVWIMALIGAITAIVWFDEPQSLYTAYYVLMAIIIVAFIPFLLAMMPLAQFIWLAAGYIIYVAGAVVYGTRFTFKNSFAGYSSHEIFHIFVLGGSFCHYWTMYFYTLA